MGTDIHMTVEVKKNKRWTVVTGNRMDFYDNYPPHPLHLGRDYYLFGILADIKNPGVAAISIPRGLPPHSPAVRMHLKSIMMNCKTIYTGPDRELTWLEIGWLGDHSFSYVHLNELLDYDWDRTDTDFLCLSETDYLEWDKVSTPQYECHHWINSFQKVSIPRKIYDFVSSDTYQSAGPLERYLYDKCDSNDDVGLYGKVYDDSSVNSRKNNKALKKPYSLYVDFEYEMPLRELTCGFYDITLPWLSRLASDPHDVRLVFGFDS